MVQPNCGAIGLGVAAGTVPVSVQLPPVQAALAAVQEWAPTIAKFLLGAGLVVLVVGVSWRLLRRRRIACGGSVGSNWNPNRSPCRTSR